MSIYSRCKKQTTFYGQKYWLDTPWISSNHEHIFKQNCISNFPKIFFDCTNTHILSIDNIMFAIEKKRERSGSVVECLTRDRGVADSSLNGITAFVIEPDTFILA